MTLELIILCLCVVGIPVNIAVSLRRSVRLMLCSPDAQEDVDSSVDFVGMLPESYRTLLESEAFRFTKAYSFHNTRFGLWVQISPDPPLRFFSLLKPQGGGPIVYEFVTALSDDCSLTTTTTRSAFLFPPPFGSFVQSFPSCTSELLWKEHSRGEEHLVDSLDISEMECRLPFLDFFRRNVIRRMSHATSFPLWAVRGVYWYLIKRFLLHNKPIWVQNIKVIYGARS